MIIPMRVDSAGLTINDVDRSYVDLGLSVNWAPWNLGSVNNPLEGGDAYLSGWYDGYDSALSVETVDTAWIYTDYATRELGEGWRVPTWDECLELIDSCKWEFMNFAEVNGYLVTGPNGKSIFIPCGTYWNSEYMEFEDVGEAGDCCLSVNDIEYTTKGQRFYNISDIRRCIRPVSDK